MGFSFFFKTHFFYFIVILFTYVFPMQAAVYGSGLRQCIKPETHNVAVEVCVFNHSPQKYLSLVVDDPGSGT